MAAFRLLLILVLALSCGCAGVRNDLPVYEYESDGVVLWKPCSRAQAEILSSGAGSNDILQSAACSAWLLESGMVKSSGFAKDSQAPLQKFLQKNPKSGLGHYLLAYLVAKEAQLAPLRGLDLVPVMEQEALRASSLDPQVDFGGPDRMLGNLYLQAPSPPVSVGDIDKALEHYEKAVATAPDFAMNRLGLATALLEDDETEEACAQYEKALKSKKFHEKLLKTEAVASLVKACSAKK